MGQNDSALNDFAGTGFWKLLIRICRVKPRGRGRATLRGFGFWISDLHAAIGQGLFRRADGVKEHEQQAWPELHRQATECGL